MSCWIQVTHLPFYFDEHSLAEMFRDVAKVIRAETDKDHVLMRTTGYVQFSNPKQARLAASKKDQCVIDGKAVRVYVAWYYKDTLSTIRVGGLPPRITARELEEHFDPYGDIVNIAFADAPPSAEISFSRVEYALRACQEMDGSIVQNSNTGLRVALVNPDARNLKHKRQAFEYKRCQIPSFKRQHRQQQAQHMSRTPPERRPRRQDRSGHGSRSADRRSQVAHQHQQHQHQHQRQQQESFEAEAYQQAQFNAHMNAQLNAQLQADLQARIQAQMQMEAQMQAQLQQAQLQQMQLQARLEADAAHRQTAAAPRSFPNIGSSMGNSSAGSASSEKPASTGQELEVPKKGHKSRRSREKYSVDFDNMDHRDLQLMAKDMELKQMRAEIEAMKLQQAQQMHQRQQQSHLSLFGGVHAPQHPYCAPHTIQVTPPQSGMSAFPFPQPLPALNLQQMPMPGSMPQGPHSLPAGMPLLSTGSLAMLPPKVLMQPNTAFLSSPAGVYRHSNPNSVASDGKSPSPLPSSAPLVYVPDRSMVLPHPTLLTSAISASATPTYSSTSGSPLATFHQSPLNLSLGTPTLPGSNSATTCSTRHPSTVESAFGKTRSNSTSTVSSLDSQSTQNLLAALASMNAAPSSASAPQYKLIVSDPESTAKKDKWNELQRRAGDTIYNILREQYPENVARITGMILALSPSEIERLLRDQDKLKARAQQMDALLRQN